MIVKKISELVSKYGVPFGYIYRILIVSEYVFTPGHLKISVCEDNLRADCWVC